MRKILLLSAFLFCLFSFAQKPKFTLGVNAVGIFPMGDNYLKDGVGNFTGVGLNFQTVFKNNMGFGIELSRAFTDVKDKSVFGELENPKLTNFTTYFLYKYPFTEAFNIEGQIGYSYMALTSRSDYFSNNYTENASAFLLGTELSYNFPKAKMVEIYASPKIYFFDSEVKFEDRDIDRYYSRAPLFNLNIGVRIYLN